MLNGIQFRAVGREKHEFHIKRHDQIFCDMPSGAIQDHDDEFIQMSFSHDGEEQTHHFRIDPGKDQAVHHAVPWADGRKGVCVFPDKTVFHDRPNTLGCPASRRSAQETKSPFILKHQPNLPAKLGLAFGFLSQLIFEFF